MPPNFHLPSPSSHPPKADPYATRAQKRFDALLLLIIALTIFIAFRSTSKDRAHRAAANAGSNDRFAQTQQVQSENR